MGKKIITMATLATDLFTKNEDVSSYLRVQHKFILLIRSIAISVARALVWPIIKRTENVLIAQSIAAILPKHD